MLKLFISRAKRARLESGKKKSIKMVIDSINIHGIWCPYSSIQMSPKSVGNKIEQSEMRKYKECCNHTWTELTSSSPASSSVSLVLCSVSTPVIFTTPDTHFSSQSSCPDTLQPSLKKKMVPSSSKMLPFFFRLALFPPEDSAHPSSSSSYLLLLP